MPFVAIVMTLLLAIVVALVALSVRARRQWVASVVGTLSDYAAELGGRVVQPRAHSVERLTLEDGRSEGRRVWLQLGLSQRSFEVRVGVEVDPSVTLKIQTPSMWGRLRRALGAGYVATGQADVDGRFLVASDDAQGAQQVFSHGGRELLEVIDELLAGGQSEQVGLVAENGWLYYDCSLPELDPRYLRWAIGRLVQVARFYERKAIKVRLKGAVAGATAERFGWTGGGQAILCPYCREDLDASAEGIVACERCHTLHHGECFAEHGGCTIFGCQGRSRELLA